jgi:hypothetical protein
VSPDFDELLGEDEDMSLEERERLRQVHELLLSASPAPRLSRRLARPPSVRRGPRRIASRPFRTALGVAAATAVAAAFGVGYVLGHVGGFPSSFTRSMHGVGSVSSARASIEVGQRDASGNRPLEMAVRGLPALPSNGWYDLYLTKKGKPEALCGTFKVGRNVVTHVRLNAPGDLGEYDGWVVEARVPGENARVLLTT